MFSTDLISPGSLIARKKQVNTPPNEAQADFF